MLYIYTNISKLNETEYTLLEGPITYTEVYNFHYLEDESLQHYS